MEPDSSLAPALTPRPPAAPPCPARWRQREVAGDHHEHVDLPLADPGAGTVADPGTDPASADAPQRPARDAELWMLARRAQGAALRIDFELRSVLVRQVFRRDFVYISRLLYALQASRRVQGLDRRCLDEALATLQRRSDDVQTLLEDMRARLQAAIAAHAPAEAQIEFARPARFQATVVSPTAHRYLALLIQADDTLAHLEMAWLLGLVEPADRTTLTSDCRRALSGFKDLVADRRQAVGAEVRAVNAQRRHRGRGHEGEGIGDSGGLDPEFEPETGPEPDTPDAPHE